MQEVSTMTVQLGVTPGRARHSATCDLSVPRSALVAVAIFLAAACGGDATSEEASPSSARNDAAVDPNPGVSADSGVATRDAAFPILPIVPDSGPRTPPTTPSVPGISATKSGGFAWTTIEFCLGDRSHGVERVSLDDGSKRTIEAERTGVSVPMHGKWYVVRERLGFDGSASHYSVVSTSDGKLLYEQTLVGAMVPLHPSPAVANLIEGDQFENDQSVGHLVVDMRNAQATLLPRSSSTSQKDLFAWLPDGSYLLLGNDGSRVIRGAGGLEKKLPSLIFPVGYALGFDMWINPEGTRHTFQLKGGAGVDVFIASISGSSVERVTQTGQSSYALWSPDGRFLAVNSDPALKYGSCADGADQLYHQQTNIYVISADVRSATSGMSFLQATGIYVDSRMLLAWTL